jgi:hypothetical protein
MCDCGVGDGHGSLGSVTVQSTAVSIVRDAKMKTIRMIWLIATLTLVGAIAPAAAEAERLDNDVRDAVFPDVGKGAIGIGGSEVAFVSFTVDALAKTEMRPILGNSRTKMRRHRFRNAVSVPPQECPRRGR